MAALALLALLYFFLGPTVANADPVLSIAITESSGDDFDADVRQVRKTGARATSLTLFWDEADQNGTYAPEFDWPSIANGYYPGRGLSLIITLSVIDTVTDRRPKDLLKKSWDDPIVIARFNAYLTEILSRMPDTDILAIAVGNEIDGHLRRDKDWQAYERFFSAARDTIHQTRPNVPVGVTMTWQGMQGNNATRSARLNALTDAALINYYPLDSRFHVLPPADIMAQLDAMIIAANGKPVYLFETGYPSEGCGSNPALQQAYFQHLLAAWHTRKRDIPLINLVWLHDIPEAKLQDYASYYGSNNRCFLSYLSSLGLRSLNGQNKPAFNWLISR